MKETRAGRRTAQQDGHTAQQDDTEQLRRQCAQQDSIVFSRMAYHSARERTAQQDEYRSADVPLSRRRTAQQDDRADQQESILSSTTKCEGKKDSIISITK